MFATQLDCQLVQVLMFVVVVLLAMAISALLGMKCGPLCSYIYIFPICLVQYSFGWNPDTKFCLHPAGGIAVVHNFTNSGEIQISGSSAHKDGGVVLRSSSWVFGTILRWP